MIKAHRARKNNIGKSSDIPFKSNMKGRTMIAAMVYANTTGMCYYNITSAKE